MELGVFDRLILLNILPKEGDFTTLKIVRKLREDLSFSEEEHKALNFQQDEGNIKWQSEADKPKEIQFGEKATDLIVSTLKKLNTDKKLTEQHFNLYSKFIGE
jgi:hypothetical protein